MMSENVEPRCKRVLLKKKNDKKKKKSESLSEKEKRGGVANPKSVLEGGRRGETKILAGCLGERGLIDERQGSQVKKGGAV